MRVIYATSDLPEWIDVAIQMREQQQWEPVYWVTTPANDMNVKEAFPQVLRQNYLDATRSRYTVFSEYVEKSLLDESVIRKYAIYERTVLKMMDRMDPTAHSFNLSERVQLYYDFLAYWLYVIKIISPDKVLFSESPHTIFMYVLYAVCKEEKIDILRFSPTHINGLTFLASSIESGTPKYLQSTYEKMFKEPESQEKIYIDRYINQKRGNYEEGIPYYMKAQIQSYSIIERLRINIGKLYRFFHRDIQTVYKKGAMFDLKNEPTKWDLLKYEWKGYRFKSALAKSYKVLVQNPDIKKPYIYVALHYQPEKTSSPEAGVFVDQWLMISMLSSCVPKGWCIYVKEHSSQFIRQLYGEQGRKSIFYEKVAALHNVSLIPVQTDSFLLIDHAKAVATLTGTVGMEALIRSKPVLIFGYPWYLGCPGVMKIREVKDLEEAIEMLKTGIVLNPKDVEHFLSAVEMISRPCYLNPGNRPGVNIDRIENSRNLVSLLINYSHRLSQ